MSKSIKQTVTIIAFIISLSALLSACEGGSGGGAGMGNKPGSLSSLNVIK